MGTRYVVTVVRVEDVESDVLKYDTSDTTLFEATHADPARLARFAPEEVLAVLAEAAGVEVTVPAVGLMPYPSWAGGDRFKLPGSFGDTSTQVPENTVTVTVEPADPHRGEVSPNDAVTEEERPKRTRRTKAQKAADDAAQALGFRDAAHQAEMRDAEAGERAEAATSEQPASDSLYPAVDAPEAPLRNAFSVPVGAQGNPAGAAPATDKPWNPFE